ncbi:hypothetical protein KYG33_05580 [Chryseobacterium sp. D764]|uniref:hypothetical protein n=1 Tax=unclassified Chryseobacterium TaxID=2593645 RepID=UPI0009852E93|nr:MULTISPECIES: hypothetical protein [unclassified Chryseobacterium]QXU50511.1 hypothetical protein KYG33_05580 [Chryseobacterium sp. D764]CAD0218995.1 conserved protein of unknown function [Chryseobacterium sp. JV274]
MRIFYLAIPILFFSCSQSIEKKCFVNHRDQVFEDYKEQKPYTIQQILNEKPDYLEIINLKEYRSFKEDSIVSHANISSDESENIFNRQDKEFKIVRDKFSDQFLYYSQQQAGNILYALGRNSMGFWLLKIENNIPKAYFIGLSFSHYYINEMLEMPIIKDGFLQFEGSLVKIIKIAGLPGYDDYSAMEDGKLFKINLKDLMKDSDNDGYNDIFEKSFGLNPDSKDTDGDGINDFDDMNPMFTSEKNKFTQLYELLLPNYGMTNMKKLHYTFHIYKNDCDYFHQINPEIRVLFIPEEKNNQTYYTRITDVIEEDISKIQTNDRDPNVFYIYESGSSFTNDYAAEYVEGKWVLKNIGGIVI